MAGNTLRASCPYCKASALKAHGVYRRSDGTRVRRYRCRLCGRTFSDATGSPAFRLRKRAEWNRMIELLSDYLPLRRVAAMLRVSLPTAFRWRHRALAILARRPRTRLRGNVCVGYFYVRYSEKGSRTCNGPGSWGYYNWLRRRVLDPMRSSGRFRLLVDGRPSVILVAQNERGYQLYNLGQGQITPERLASGLKALVRAGSVVYAYDSRYFAAACEQSGLHFRDASQALRRARGRRTEPGDCWDGLPAVPEYAYGWFWQFHGIATRYLNHYIAWYCEIVRKCARSRQGGSSAADLDALRAVS